MNTKIAMSGLSILASLALMGGATFAFFSDSGTSTGNTFSSGTVDLSVDDANESPAPSVTGSLTVSDFVPGQSTTGFISLHNSGSIAMAEVALDIDTSETADPTPASDMRDVLNLTVLVDDATPDATCTGGTNVTSAIDTAVGNGITPLTLGEFDNGGTDHYDSLLTGTGLAPGAEKNICFTVTFDSSANNDYQGDAVNSTFTFTAHQDATQI